MAQVIASSGHDDMIHDAVLDYYGRRLATCSSDKTIKIFEVEGDSHKLIETLRGHEGAVWCVSWAHPKYGSILASSSYDSRVLIWRSSPAPATSGASSQQATSTFQRVAEFTHHTASVNIVAWAPHEAGCLLACASSDGKISVLEFQEGNWSHQLYDAHPGGANAVSWAPAIVSGGLISPKGGELAREGGGSVRRFCTGGSDCAVRIWDWNPQTKSYSSSTTLDGHTDWVRDVAWAPSLLSKNYIASCSQDKTVRIWTSTSANPNEWTCTKLDFDAALWRVSWSLSGNVLAVSGGDNRVSLWKEDLKGEWSCAKWIEE